MLACAFEEERISQDRTFAMVNVIKGVNFCDDKVISVAATLL